MGERHTFSTPFARSNATQNKPTRAHCQAKTPDFPSCRGVYSEEHQIHLCRVTAPFARSTPKNPENPAHQRDHTHHVSVDFALEVAACLGIQSHVLDSAR